VRLARNVGDRDWLSICCPNCIGEKGGGVAHQSFVDGDGSRLPEASTVGADVGAKLFECFDSREKSS